MDVSGLCVGTALTLCCRIVPCFFGLTDAVLLPHSLANPTDNAAPQAYAAFLDSVFDRITNPKKVPLDLETPALDTIMVARTDDLKPEPEQVPAEPSGFNKIPAVEGNDGGWRDMKDVLPAVGSGAAAMDGVPLQLLPPPARKKSKDKILPKKKQKERADHAQVREEMPSGLYIHAGA